MLRAKVATIMAMSILTPMLAVSTAHAGPLGNCLRKVETLRDQEYRRIRNECRGSSICETVKASYYLVNFYNPGIKYCYLRYKY
jgi:hypothetical protein